MVRLENKRGRRHYNVVTLVNPRLSGNEAETLLPANDFSPAWQQLRKAAVTIIS